MYEYSGAIHIHSVYSDGTGKIEDIAKAASESNLDFIIMTDHNTLQPKDDGYEKWLNNVLVIVGYEINDMDNQNHYLALGTDKIAGEYEKLPNGELGCKLDAAQYVKEISDAGGIGFTAHPDETRHINGMTSYPWTDWESDEITGIEIWNHMSEWVEGMKKNNRLNRFIHPLKSIISPPKKTIKRWDKLSQKRRVVGIGGVDAHAFKQSLLGFFEVEIFSYKVLFKSIRTNVILSKPLNTNNSRKTESDKNMILDALKNGKCYVTNYYHGDSKGFRFFAEYNAEHYIMGETITKEGKENVILKTYIPKVCKYKLIHNGKLVDERLGFDGVWEVKNDGVYRVECWKNNKGWIFSNHIRVINEK